MQHCVRTCVVECLGSTNQKRQIIAQTLVFCQFAVSVSDKGNELWMMRL